MHATIAIWTKLQRSMKRFFRVVSVAMKYQPAATVGPWNAMIRTDSNVAGGRNLHGGPS